MKITLEMVLTRFFLNYPELKTEYTNAEQQLLGIQLLPAHADRIRKGFLYISGTYEEDFLFKTDPSVPVVCFIHDSDIISALPNITIIYSDLDLADGFNMLQKYYNDFIEWGRQMDFAVFRDASFQEFIDLSEEIMASPILIYDPALKLLAYSKVHVANDHISYNAIKHGYLDIDTVKYFDKDHVFDRIRNTGFSFGAADGFRGFSDFTRAINIRNELAVYCILLYTNGFPKNYINQLFQIFCDSIQNLLEKQHSNFLKNRTITDYFLMDLLDNPDLSKEQIKERLDYNDLDYEGNYIVISLHSDMEKKTSGNYFIQLLRNNMINCRIFAYQKTIVILYLLPKFKEADYKDYLTGQFQDILKDSHQQKITLYFSRPFTNIGQFSAAYIQAENICRILKNECTKRFYFYEDYWIQDLFFMNRSAEKLFSYCDAALLAMFSKNTKKSSQQMQILYEYLNCDRKLTETANKLNMHRNNVLYHIKNIEEKYRLNLDDPTVRLKLLLSFELLKYEGEHTLIL